MVPLSRILKADCSLCDLARGEYLHMEVAHQRAQATRGGGGGGGGSGADLGVAEAADAGAGSGQVGVGGEVAGLQGTQGRQLGQLRDEVHTLQGLGVLQAARLGGLQAPCGPAAHSQASAILGGYMARGPPGRGGGEEGEGGSTLRHLLFRKPASPIPVGP